MSSEWPLIKLNELCLKITDGAHQSPKSVTTGKPMASVKDLTRFGVDLSNARLISEEDFNVLIKQGCKPEVGDVLIAKDGNSALDTVCSVDTELDAVLLSSVAILRPDKSKILTNYLKHYLSSADVIDYLKSNFISGAAIPRVVLKDFKKADIRVPPLPEQEAIASVLEALDSRIKVLRETNATLEAIAQALFKSWFVDFDPVRAKVEGLEPQAMEAPTAALFPDSFEESELGLVPKGWQVGPVGDFVQVVDYVANGSFASLKENVTLLDSPSFALYVRTTDYNSGFSGSFRYVDKQAYDFLSKSSLKGNEVLISNVGDVGTVFRAPSWLGMPMTLGSNAVALKAPELSGFLFFYFKGEKGQHDIQSVITGSAQLKFNKTSFRSLRIAIPEVSVLQRFESIAGEILTKIDNNLAQVKALTQLRDTLLPRLISGQLRLPEAQAWVAEVG